MTEPLFNAEDFMSQTTEDEMDTHVIPIPENEYSPAIIGKVAPSSGVSDKGPWACLDVFWGIENAELSNKLGREKLISKQRLFLDVDETGRLMVGTGQNVQLGRLREAVGQNGPRPWSPSRLVCQAGTVLAENYLYEGATSDRVTKRTACA